MGQRELLNEIKIMIQSTQPVIGIETTEEERVRDLVFRASQELSIPYFDWTITRGIRSNELPAIEGTEDPFVCLQYIKDYRGDAIFLLKDIVQHLDKPVLIRQFREAAQRAAKQRNSIVLVAPFINIPKEIQHKVFYQDWHLPTREELHTLITTTFEQIQRENKNTKFDMSREDFDSLISALSGMTWKQAREILTYTVVYDGSLNKTDVQRILDRKALALRDGSVLEYFPPNKLPAQIGGFNKLKEFCDRARKSFAKGAVELKIPSAKGILLVGVPGCGKSMAAKAVAAKWNVPLLKLDTGRLFDKYVGESEKNFNKAIRTAESMAPAILWIDEIEKAMPMGSGQDSDGGLSRRLFGSFLTWLQEKTTEVFVIATANDLSSLPPELLRKGRFDEIFFVDLPTDTERVEILKLHLTQRQLNLADFNFVVLAEKTKDFSGAELEHIVIAALLESIHKGSSMSTEQLINEVDRTIPLARSRFDQIAELRETAKRQFVPVN